MQGYPFNKPIEPYHNLPSRLAQIVTRTILPQMRAPTEGRLRDLLWGQADRGRTRATAVGFQIYPDGVMRPSLQQIWTPHLKTLAYAPYSSHQWSHGLSSNITVSPQGEYTTSPRRLAVPRPLTQTRWKSTNKASKVSAEKWTRAL